MTVPEFVKAFLGLTPDSSDEKARGEWDKRTKNVCKPCWELKYCPYGRLVEEFPLLDLTRQEAIEYYEFVKGQLRAGAYDEAREEVLAKELEDFDPSEYPERHDDNDVRKACSVFGHLCPVFFVMEPFTDTSNLR